MPELPRSALIVTDAWHPQVNGVVRSIERIGAELSARGIRVDYLTPQDFWTVPMPGYQEIALAMARPDAVGRRIDAVRPESIHIATEGPLGYVARSYCVKRRLPFSTAYHTQFPEYLRARLPVPLLLSYRYMRWFHAAATWCLVGTPYLQKLLEQRGFTNTAIWTKGVDTDLFSPAHRTDLPHPKPIFLYVGRVAVEKNIEAFLKLDLPGTKLVVGGGPSLERLRTDYPHVVFAGQHQGVELARFFASADVFVFPSRTDTFGLVLLEALASGTPVAAYPVTGPIDVIGTAPVGVLDEDLGAAAMAALGVSRDACRAHSLQFSWTASAEQFLRHLPRIELEAAEAFTSS
jgi:glycosyltransferase involved in cell wall biosynthesis